MNTPGNFLLVFCLWLRCSLPAGSAPTSACLLYLSIISNPGHDFFPPHRPYRLVKTLSLRILEKIKHHKENFTYCLNVCLDILVFF